MSLPFSPRSDPVGAQVSFQCSPDGGRVLLRKPDGAWVLYSLASEAIHPLVPMLEEDHVISWGRDGIYVRRGDSMETERIDLEGGRRVPWRRLAIADATGVEDVLPAVVIDRNTYAFSYVRWASHLGVLDGLR